MQILLTRPLSQVGSLQNILTRQGDTALLFPSLTIQALTPAYQSYSIDMLIFISVNAVNYALAHLSHINTDKVCIVAVGQMTKKCLEYHGFQVNICPEKQASSQALLAMPEMKNLHNTRILIVRGLGGLETLKQTLIKQNNTVKYLEVYQRVSPNISQEHRDSLAIFLSKKQGIIVIHSIESLKSFVALVEAINPSILPKIKHYPIALFSPRIAQITKQLGFIHQFIATQSNDTGLVEAIKQGIDYWSASQEPTQTR